jgi:hypothetical protein
VKFRFRLFLHEHILHWHWFEYHQSCLGKAWACRYPHMHCRFCSKLTVVVLEAA